MSGNRLYSELAVAACVDSYLKYGVVSAGGFSLPRVVEIAEEGSWASAYVGHGFGVLCYRGTDALDDWLDNLKMTMCKPKGFDPEIYNRPFIPNCKPLFHRGFYGAYRRLHQASEWILDKYASEVDEWIVTGHSLGGAMANIACLKLQQLEKPKLITFGAPRWGNRDACWLASQETSLMLRFRNGSDIVPLLPAPFGRWKHACPEIRLNGSHSSRLIGSHNIYDYRVGLQRYTGRN